MGFRHPCIHLLLLYFHRSINCLVSINEEDTLRFLFEDHNFLVATLLEYDAPSQSRVTMTLTLGQLGPIFSSFISL